jgi:large subunit ribosomal protein L23
MLRPEQIILRPIILTEKSARLRNNNTVTFEVHQDANKIQVRDAIRQLFKVEVADVNVMIVRGKERRMGRGYAKLQNWKKAMVTLKSGSSIEFFDAEPAAEASPASEG